MKDIPPEILERLKIKQDHESHGGFTISKISHEVKMCEDCGDPVKDRRVEYSINQNSKAVPHIKQRCKNCNLYKNPETGVYDMSFSAINAYFVAKKKNLDK